MDLRAVVLTLAIAGTLIGCSGGTTIRPTTRPKLDAGWTPWESWKNKVYVGLPKNYLQYALGSSAMSAFLRELDEKFPEMKEMLQKNADAPDIVLTALELNHAKLPEFVDHFTIHNKKGWPKMSLEDFIAAVKRDPDKFFPGAKNVSAEEQQHPNGAIARVEYETSMQLKPNKAKALHSMAYVFISGDDSHLVTFTTIKSRLKASRPTFEKAIENFRVTAG